MIQPPPGSSSACPPDLSHLLWVGKRSAAFSTLKTTCSEKYLASFPSEVLFCPLVFCKQILLPTAPSHTHFSFSCQPELLKLSKISHHARITELTVFTLVVAYCCHNSTSTEIWVFLSEPNEAQLRVSLLFFFSFLKGREGSHG